MDDKVDILDWEDIKVYTVNGDKCYVKASGDELYFRSNTGIDIREM